MKEGKNVSTLIMEEHNLIIRVVAYSCDGADIYTHTYILFFNYGTHTYRVALLAPENLEFHAKRN